MAVPIPQRDIEFGSTWSSPCLTRQMTDEEKLIYSVEIPAPRNTDGIQAKKPIELGGNPKYANVTKEFVLAEFSKGKTVLQIEKEQGMLKNTLYARLCKWGIRSPHSPKYSKSENEQSARKSPKSSRKEGKP